jgi:hypothetical protein
MKTGEFLAAISIAPNEGFQPVSQNQVLETCNNFVVFDAQMDTFRFAHLSVREFLEKQPTYNAVSTNSLAAEICLLHVISRSPVSRKGYFRHRGHQWDQEWTPQHDFSKYSNIYWATHCQLAGTARTQTSLREPFQFFLSDDADAATAFLTWLREINNITINWNLGYQLHDCNAGMFSALFVATAFDFPEIIKTHFTVHKDWARLQNKLMRSIFKVSTCHGSFNVLALLVKQQRGDEVQITEEVLQTAAGNESSGTEMMALLLERGDEVQITENVIKAAVSNRSSGKKVMALLLEQRGDEVQITENVIKAAVRNRSSGKKVMALLLEQRRDEVHITEEVLKVAAGKYGSTTEVMALLLEQRGDEVQITEEVLKAAIGNDSSGKEVMALLLERGDEVQITEEVLKAAAGNESSGTEMMALLLGRGDEVQITEEVLKAAARNNSSGKKVMALLLKQRDEVQITEDVLKAAAGNDGSGKKLMALLLEQRGDEVQITYEVLKALARNTSRDSILLPFTRKSNEVWIAELDCFEQLSPTLSRFRGSGGWIRGSGGWIYLKG